MYYDHLSTALTLNYLDDGHSTILWCDYSDKTFCMIYFPIHVFLAWLNE